MNLQKVELRHKDKESIRLHGNVEAHRELLKAMAGRSDYQKAFLKKRYDQSLARFIGRQKNLDANNKILEESSQVNLD